MTWQPDPAGVQQISELLAEFQKPGADQALVLNRLEQCRCIPHFNKYLAYIFAVESGLPLEVRQSAGLLLKNDLLRPAGRELERDAFVSQALLVALQHPEKVLRHTAGTCVVSYVRGRGLTSWPELPSALAQMLEEPPSVEGNVPKGSVSKVDGALDALFKLWEETPELLEAEFPPGSNQRPSDVLTPKTLVHMHHTEAKIRALAIHVLNLAANYMPRGLLSNIEMYTQGLFQLATDPDAEVRKAVCSGLVQLITISPDHIQQQLPAIIEYMLATTQDTDEDIAVIACEFWSALAESGIDAGVLRPYLPQLLPILLRHMVWEEYDDEVVDAETAESEALSGHAIVPDKDSDIRPHRHVQTVHGEDNANEDEEEEVGQWNLRRCSAAGLDMLSTVFGDELLPLLLPTIESRLQDSDWRARESAILALGAVSQGCSMGLNAHLPVITGALLAALSDPRPLVRCISCWALTRYARGLLDRSKEGDRGLLDRVVDGVCGRVNDHNRVVQGAACGSIANLAEEAEETDLLPYSDKIFTALGEALASGRYGRRGLRYAYDAIATIAENCPAAFQMPSNASAILPPLFLKLSMLPDGDKDILPLLECLGTVAVATGATHLRPFAETSFRRCVDIADGMRAGAASGAYDKDEADEFVIGALDALSGFIEALGAGAESLIGKTALKDILVLCVTLDSNPEIRQSGFAVLGDIARFCFPYIRSSLREIVQAALTHLEPSNITHVTIGACNNAAWSLGEMTLQCSSEEVDGYAMAALERIVPILMAPKGSVPRSLLDNVAVLLGRIGKVRYGSISPHASVFVGPWCSVLRNIRDGNEKRDAFLGLCAVVGTIYSSSNDFNSDRDRRMKELSGFWSELCQAAVSWRELRDPELRECMLRMMQTLKKFLEDASQWDVAWRSLSGPVQTKLREMYGL